MWVLVFVLLALASYLFMSLMEQSKQETTRQRLERLVRQRKTLESFQTKDLPDDPVDAAVDDETKSRRSSAKKVLVGMVEKATTGRRFSNRLEVRLLRADWRWKPAEFMVAQGLAAGMGLGVAVIWAQSLWWLLLILGWVVPHFLLSRAEKLRLKTFDQQLPDALAIIANSLRSGYSFLQAMDVVSREMPPPICKEFGMVIRETRVNIPLDESLGNLVQRLKSADLDLVVTAVLIQRQVGGNLSEVLEKISGTIKERVRLQGEIRTLTTQGRFSGWIVSLLPLGLAVLMQVVSPGFLKPMYTHPLGYVLIGIGIIMEGIGIMVIKGMVNLEV